MSNLNCPLASKIVRTASLLPRVINSLDTAAREHAATRGPDWSGTLCNAALELLGEPLPSQVTSLVLSAEGLFHSGNIDVGLLLPFESRLVLLACSMRRPYSDKLVRLLDRQ